MRPKTPPSARPAGRVAVGLALIAAGVLFLLDNANLVYDAWHDYWPVLLIVIGLAHWVSPERRYGGTWLIFIGAVMLMHSLDVFRLSDSWPLFIVAGGLSAIWTGLRGESRCCPAGECDDPREARDGR